MLPQHHQQQAGHYYAQPSRPSINDLIHPSDGPVNSADDLDKIIEQRKARLQEHSNQAIQATRSLQGILKALPTLPPLSTSQLEDAKRVVENNWRKRKYVGVADSSVVPPPKYPTNGEQYQQPVVDIRHSATPDATNAATPTTSHEPPRKRSKKASRTPKPPSSPITDPSSPSSPTSTSTAASQSKKRRTPWTPLELATLEAGMLKHGTHWSHLLSDPEFADVLKNRSQMQCKDKAAVERERIVKLFLKEQGREPREEELGVWRWGCVRGRVKGRLEALKRGEGGVEAGDGGGGAPDSLQPQQHTMLNILALTALVASVSVSAAPAPAKPLPAFFSPESVFAAPEGEAARVSVGTSDAAEIATAYVSSRFRGAEPQFIVKDSHKTGHNGVSHVYLQETYNGLPVVNLVSNVNVDSTGAVLSAGTAQVSAAEVASNQRVISTEAKINQVDAVLSFAKAIGSNVEAKDLVYKEGKVTGAPFAAQDIPIDMKYYLTAQNKLELVYGMLICFEGYYQAQTENNILSSSDTDFNVDQNDKWFNVFVSASTGEILGATNWVADGDENVDIPSTSVEKQATGTTPSVSSGTNPAVAGPIPTYLAIPITENDVTTKGQVKLVNPAKENASPNGWHSAPNANGELNTTGNNVKAAKGSTQAISKNGGDFNYPYDPTKGADDAVNVPAAIVNTFYVTNAYHDLLYQYGFTEASGNFQNDNFDKGGAGKDGVIANVQASGTNNANFATPADGGAGRMNMYLFTYTTPKRDSDLENGIIVHELTHGLSIRLTGGPANSNCLGGGEAGGMGEGWGDTLSWVFSAQKSWTDKKNVNMGEWVLGGGKGIRQYPYSTDKTVNPMTYSTVAKNSEVHAIGTVWSEILYDVYWNMVNAHGFTDNLTDNATSDAGNARFLQLLVDGMKFQPCNPTFISARDAILQADKTNYKGKYRCLLWKGFAKRGLGVNAAKRVDNFELPADC
ncbi:Fungalysin/Thermolysin Extracellular metalloproteinase 5 [Chytridiales sp. JEL 0842]|nr:Fungalysin/Thermolysin Extracellular metalloproteinase 5 [Chytridiales sp. JEL 0842]